MVVAVEAAIAHIGRRPGRGLIYAGVASGIVLSAVAGGISYGDTASVEHRTLSEIGIDPIDICIGHLITDEALSSTAHFHVGPKKVTIGGQNTPFGKLPSYTQTIPDVWNRTWDMQAKFFAKVCINGAVLNKVRPDPNDPTKYDMTVIVDGEEDVSDVNLIVAPVPDSVEFTEHGDFSDALYGAVAGIFKAAAQAVGHPKVKVPGHGVDATLQDSDLLIGEDAVDAGPNNCADLGVKELNIDKTKKVSDDDPNLPKTLMGQLDHEVIDADHAAHPNEPKLTEADFINKLIIHTGHTKGNMVGIPNQDQAKINKWRQHAKDTENHDHGYFTVEDPSKYPACKDDTGNASIMASASSSPSASPSK